LEKELSQAQRTVRDLEEKLMSLEQHDLRMSSKGKDIVIFMDGAFDMMHYGHMNAFRQGRALGTKLVVGVNSDETITACKGKPVCSESERIACVRGCKWVDEVVEHVPYLVDDEYLRQLIDKYQIDYVVHGDDPCIVDGKNAYESAIKLGKYLTIPRTEGISTTDIVGRMLLVTRSHHCSQEEALALIDDDVNPLPANDSCDFKLVSGRKASSPSRSTYRSSTNSAANSSTSIGYFQRKSNFLTTSLKLRLFGAGLKAPQPTDKVVYLAGAWDMFHAGHIETLRKAKEFGEFTLVGVHNDSVVNEHRGMNLPIMNLHERVLSVLGCKWVDDVLIDAPYAVTQDMIHSLKIDVVVTGAISTASDDSRNGTVKSGDSSNEEDPYLLPRQLGILRVVQCSTSMSVVDFIDRIQSQKEKFSQKYARKAQLEEEFYKDKYNVL